MQRSRKRSHSTSAKRDDEIIVPVSWPIQSPQSIPRRNSPRRSAKTLASSMMQAVPAALSVACGPNQES